MNAVATAMWALAPEPASRAVPGRPAAAEPTLDRRPPHTADARTIRVPARSPPRGAPSRGEVPASFGAETRTAS